MTTTVRSGRVGTLMLLTLVALGTALMGCGKKKGGGGGGGGGGRDAMKLCKALEKKGFASDCAVTTSALDPALAGATTLVGFTATHEPGGVGQYAIFPDEAAAKTAFMTLRESRGNLVGDYPTKIVIYWEMSGESARADDGMMGAIRGAL